SGETVVTDRVRRQRRTRRTIRSRRQHPSYGTLSIAHQSQVFSEKTERQFAEEFCPGQELTRKTKHIACGREEPRVARYSAAESTVGVVHQTPNHLGLVSGGRDLALEPRLGIEHRA